MIEKKPWNNLNFLCANNWVEILYDGSSGGRAWPALPARNVINALGKSNFWCKGFNVETLKVKSIFVRHFKCIQWTFIYKTKNIISESPCCDVMVVARGLVFATS